MPDTAVKPQQGAFTAFVRKLLHWGSEAPPTFNSNGHESSTKSKRADSVYSSYDPSTDVSSLAPSGMSMGNSSHANHNHIFIGNSLASPLATPPQLSTPPDHGLDSAMVALNAPQETNMVVSVVEPIHNPSLSSRTPSCRAGDTASVLTIASSSKRRRRRSIDTNASTRALFAESIFSSTDAE